MENSETTYQSEHGTHFILNEAKRNLLSQIFNLLIGGEFIPFPYENTIVTFSVDGKDIASAKIQGHGWIDEDYMKKEDFDEEFWIKYDNLSKEEKENIINELEADLSTGHIQQFGFPYRKNTVILERLRRQCE